MRRRLAVGKAERKMTYALIIALDAEFFKNFFSIRGFKLFFCTVDPAGRKSERMRGKHHIAENKAAVVNVCRSVLFCKHDQNDRCTVKWVRAVSAHNGGIHFHQTVTQFAVCYSNDYRALPVHSACGIKSRIRNLGNQGLLDRIGLEFSDAVSGLYIFDYFMQKRTSRNFFYSPSISHFAGKYNILSAFREKGAKKNWGFRRVVLCQIKEAESLVLKYEIHGKQYGKRVYE